MGLIDLFASQGLQSNISRQIDSVWEVGDVASLKRYFFTTEVEM